MSLMSIPEAAEAVNLNYGGTDSLQQYDIYLFDHLVKSIHKLIADGRVVTHTIERQHKVEVDDIIAVIEEGNNQLTRVW